MSTYLKGFSPQNELVYSLLLQKNGSFEFFIHVDFLFEFKGTYKLRKNLMGKQEMIEFTYENMSSPSETVPVVIKRRKGFSKIFDGEKMNVFNESWEFLSLPFKPSLSSSTVRKLVMFKSHFRTEKEKKSINSLEEEIDLLQLIPKNERRWIVESVNDIDPILYTVSHRSQLKLLELHNDGKQINNLLGTQLNLIAGKDINKVHEIIEQETSQSEKYVTVRNLYNHLDSSRNFWESYERLKKYRTDSLDK
ncbi:MAG: hypothetical protein Terrestrivirus13_13 [Terrestrivirus sp.]|uniref:Uncharacterized protein n=1 Tax=Terrestrivirus sp. TaxID=2487775 RepID=A0A3G4ZPD5_9VIRU|nr:MAG: hypothetical protein Terrestrivirus13_13 [Terrestrivirus sp.]